MKSSLGNRAAFLIFDKRATTPYSESTMSKAVSGSIPEKIVYVCAKEREVNVGCAWDISWHADEKSKNVTMKVLPAFPVDSKDPKGKETAIRWAEAGHYDYKTKQQITNPHQEEEFDNSPITGIKVLSLEERGQGGRAYKVVINDKFYVDMREDVMMDAMLKSGISPGGILNGTFVWAKVGSHTKIVRVGSELHKMVVEFDSKKDMRPIGKRALEFGGLYQDRKKNMAVFLGYVNTTVYRSNETRPAWGVRESLKPKFDFNHTFLKKQMLFYEVNQYDGLDKSLAQMKNDRRNYGYRIRKSHSYIEKIKDVEVPNDITDFLRKQARHEIKDHILEYTGDKKSQYRRDAWNLCDSTCSLSEMLNLYAFEANPVELFDIKKFLLFT